MENELPKRKQNRLQNFDYSTNGINKTYDNINKFIVMPNHLHLIIEINNVDGASGTTHPTNLLISSFINTLKGTIRHEVKYDNNNTFNRIHGGA